MEQPSAPLRRGSTGLGRNPRALDEHSAKRRQQRHETIDEQFPHMREDKQLHTWIAAYEEYGLDNVIRRMGGHYQNYAIVSAVLCAFVIRSVRVHVLQASRK